jgi:hypothetical protein
MNIQMTEQHIEVLADAIGSEVYPSRMEEIADKIQEINPRFNRKKFIDRAERAWLNAHKEELEVYDYIPY